LAPRDPGASTLSVFQLFRELDTSRTQGRDSLPSVPAIDFEIPIQREDQRVRTRFGHEDQARIGQGNLLIGIAREKSLELANVLLRLELQLDQSALEQVEHGGRTLRKCAHQKDRFGQNRVAGDERRLESPHHFCRPSMLSIVAIQECNQRPCIYG
ncbi:MAG: hypothetical protein MUF51_07360, partial [Vicinamibacteria bacterium]|nr:hypothetical protein [Vicinamibacteria bacterium]